MDTEDEVISLFKSLVNNPEDVAEWLIYIRRQHEQHVEEIVKLKAKLSRLEISATDGSEASEIMEQLQHIYDSRADEIYVDFRRRFKVEKLTVASQAKLDEVYYELIKSISV